MNCTKRPQNYLVWHLEHDFWKPGDLAALCPQHAALTLARIRASELLNCDLLATRPSFADDAQCNWNLHWPLVDELKTIVLA